MGSLDISLYRQDFNGASNGVLLNHVHTNKLIMQCYLASHVYDIAVAVSYPDEPGRETQYFSEANFSDPRFVHAIDSYLIGDCRTIIKEAPERNIVAEVEKQFDGFMDVIEMGYLPVRRNFYRSVNAGGRKAANVNFNPVNSLGVLISLADYRIGGP